MNGRFLALPLSGAVARRLATLALVSLFLILVVGMVGCGNKTQEGDIDFMPDDPGVSDETVTVPTEEIPIVDEDPEVTEMRAPDLNLQPVFFNFDQYGLSSDAREILNTTGRLLKDNANVKVLIEGHCDERGTVQYNLALGEKRAKAARDYLANLGISRSRMEVISYGKERPFRQGHSESAWGQNRRAHFVQR